MNIKQNAILKYKKLYIEIDKNKQFKLKVRKQTWQSTRLMNISASDLAVLNDNELAELKLELYKFINSLGKK